MRRWKAPYSRPPLGAKFSATNFVSHAIGGGLNTLTIKEKHKINDGVLHILSEIGLEHIPKIFRALC